MGGFLVGVDRFGAVMICPCRRQATIRITGFATWGMQTGTQERCLLAVVRDRGSLISAPFLYRQHM